MFAARIPTRRRPAIASRDSLSRPLESIVAEIRQSVVSDAAAQRLLSTVESKPESTIIRSGANTHGGSRDVINSTFTMPTSAGIKPVPAAANPIVPIERGTTAKIKAPIKNDLPMRSLRIAKVRCQKHWSPNGPEIRPTAVGRPKPRNTESPVSENRDTWSPVMEPRPAMTAPTPPALERPQGTRRAQPSRIMASWITSVVTDALRPEKHE